MWELFCLLIVVVRRRSRLRRSGIRGSVGARPTASREIASGWRDDPAGPSGSARTGPSRSRFPHRKNCKLSSQRPPAQHDHRYLHAAEREYRRVNAAARPSAGVPWASAITSWGRCAHAQACGAVREVPVARRATVVFVAIAAADTLLAATRHDRLRWLTKPLLIPALMVGRGPPTQRALALGGVGDVALLGSSDAAFTAGLASFPGRPRCLDHCPAPAPRRRAPPRPAGPGGAVPGSVRRAERVPVEAHRQGPHPGHRL